MGFNFMELWGERVDPGKVGTIEFGEEHEACESRVLVVLRFVFVMVALPTCWFLAIPHVPLPMWQAVAAVIGGTLIYIALGYLINPQPDLDNLGHCGGMIDHQWRYSDDMNRSLFAVQCLLGPGKFVAESLFDIRLLLRDNSPDTDSA